MPILRHTTLVCILEGNRQKPEACKPHPYQLQLMAVQVDILCTHPMFGPDSGKGSWQGLNFMYERVRIGTSSERQQRVKILLQVLPQPCLALSASMLINALESIVLAHCGLSVSRKAFLALPTDDMAPCMDSPSRLALWRATVAGVCIQGPCYPQCILATLHIASAFCTACWRTSP